MEEMRHAWIRIGCSIVMGGWIDIWLQPLINIIVTPSLGSCFVKAIVCFRKHEDVDYYFDLLEEAIEEITCSRSCVSSTHFCKLPSLIVENTQKHIFGLYVLCIPWKLFERHWKIDLVKIIVAEARDIQMFVCNYHTSFALFWSSLKKEFIKLVEIRHTSYFLLMERMLEVQDVLQSMVVCGVLKKWAQSKTINEVYERKGVMILCLILGKKFLFRQNIDIYKVKITSSFVSCWHIHVIQVL